MLYNKTASNSKIYQKNLDSGTAKARHTFYRGRARASRPGRATRSITACRLRFRINISLRDGVVQWVARHGPGYSGGEGSIPPVIYFFENTHSL